MICKGTFDYSTRNCYEYRAFFVSSQKRVKAVFIINQLSGDALSIVANKKATIDEILEIVDAFENRYGSKYIKKYIKIRGSDEKRYIEIKKALPSDYVISAKQFDNSKN